MLRLKRSIVIVIVRGFVGPVRREVNDTNAVQLAALQRKAAWQEELPQATRSCKPAKCRDEEKLENIRSSSFLLLPSMTEMVS